MHPAGLASRQFEPAWAEDKDAAVLVVEVRRKLGIVAVPFSAEADAEAGSRSCWGTASTHSAVEKKNMLAVDTAEEDVAAVEAADIVASSEDTPYSSSFVSDQSEKSSLTGKSRCASGPKARSQRYPRRRHRAERREKGGNSGVGNLGDGIDLPCFYGGRTFLDGRDGISFKGLKRGGPNVYCSLQRRFIMVVVPGE